ncbi:exosortase/archaeosortase family protein, partial [bacterium]|nr:exosortase/archaeosortase family protein [bacterium]
MRNSKARMACTVAVIAVVHFFLFRLDAVAWHYLGSAFLPLSVAFLNGLFPDITSLYAQHGDSVRVSTSSFAMLVGKPCSSFDGMLMFSFLFTLVYFTREKANRPDAGLKRFGLGLLGAFALNQLRILLLFFAGEHKVFNAVHYHSGYLLYVGYILVFLSILTSGESQRKRRRRMPKFAMRETLPL